MYLLLYYGVFVYMIYVDVWFGLNDQYLVDVGNGYQFYVDVVYVFKVMQFYVVQDGQDM